MLQERRSKLVKSRIMMSTVTPLVAEPPAAARAGADLRAARERLGLSLDDVVLALRIRTPHIEALEEGRISLLPGNAYALAFVRTYATALGLDAEEMVRRFRTEAAEFGQQTELVFPVPRAPSCCWGSFWWLGLMPGGIVCPATGGCRPKRLPQYRNGWRLWRNRRCRRLSLPLPPHRRLQRWRRSTPKHRSPARASAKL